MAYKDDWKRSVPGHAPLRELHEQLRDEMRARWQRAVPFADELFDRWERARYLGFGEGTSIYDASVVLGDVTVGEKTWIGPFTVLDGSGGLRIGRIATSAFCDELREGDLIHRVYLGGHAATPA